MNKKVVLNSLHSSSLKYIRDYEPDLIVSLDSHLDIQFMVEETWKVIKERAPQDLREVMLRAYVHFMMSRNAKAYLVIPKTCFEFHALHDFAKARQLFDLDITRKTVRSIVGNYRNLLRKMRDLGLMDLSLYLSPPKNIKKLADKVKGKNTIVDVDVDYMGEFQGECYTTLPDPKEEPEKGRFYPELKFGSEGDVIRLIKLIDPPLITISEYLPE
ncbi:hypothetical protein AKJ35_01020 [candidate division MSBL1 archaeon SCGC-AAA833F18]|uniref:Uncharacterized protein n=1 Tax=candidate division MSBL1 archaeon SCGC-AAA833F18 TaxID=1698257 RepID=A0A133VSB3_9EURY|nr:hypothetical protein AKJ35_01020 [candidate division MSBL1 archaeon SCGC-AAA833F18]